jgi:hypothetical protein
MTRNTPPTIQTGPPPHDSFSEFIDLDQKNHRRNQSRPVVFFFKYSMITDNKLPAIFIFENLPVHHLVV